MSTNSFRGTAPQCVVLNPLDFYLWGHSKILVYSAPIENAQTFHQCITDYSVEISTRCSFAIEFIIPKFFEGSTCFELHTAHLQEL
jgi:hypothetical protein